MIAKYLICLHLSFAGIFELGTQSKKLYVAEIDEISLLMDDKIPKAVKEFVNNVLILGIIDLDETVIPNTWI